MADTNTTMGKGKQAKITKVKNKMPAPIQVTAEQLLREAKETEMELVPPPPKQKIADEAELKDYQMRKRKSFEDNIRKNRSSVANWLKYAAWEEQQQTLRNARSVYERALDVDYRNVTFWLKYAEMEMRCRQVNSARNIWDRAVTILPRVNQFWYKYTYMEERLNNIAGCRQVFERWMEWEPEEQAWHSYINYELRYKELDRARVIYERFVIVHPVVKNWIKYARFEEKHGMMASSRAVYERGMHFFGDEHLSQTLILSFAHFEEQQKEHERARVIYKWALERLPKEQCQEIFKLYSLHQKKFADKSAIEDVIVSKRRFIYEDKLSENRYDYCTWFSYVRLLEADGGDVDKVREVYERAIANVPPSLNKSHWSRYIYLWINYAIYEELEAKDLERTEQVYKMCLQVIPHKHFTFAKVWILYSKFEVRRRNLQAARKIMGTAIGMCPKEKLFHAYISMELKLYEMDRIRTLYEKFLAFLPTNSNTWIEYAQLEASLHETDRARSIFELATQQQQLDIPEKLWKAYIEFETERQEFDRVRSIYQRILQRTHHIKVWLSWAQFEMSVSEECGGVERVRGVYREAHDRMKLGDDELKEERVTILNTWKIFEEEYGDEGSLDEVQKILPQQVLRTRKVLHDGTEQTEEYMDYIFTDSHLARPNLKLLSMAKSWKKS